MRHEIPNEGLYVSLLNMSNVCCNANVAMKHPGMLKGVSLKSRNRIYSIEVIFQDLT